MDWGKKRQECNCCLEVKDSLVIIICRDLDENDLCASYKTFIDIKGNDKANS
ncbi:MAG TPA: hypothetical protein GX502_07820 [Syntrophaceticus sp.]|nr:hypothetical protein [Syntrophaceticus sp.]